MRIARWTIAVVVIVGLGVSGCSTATPSPGCIVAGGAQNGSFNLTTTQAGNAATIAAVGLQVGMPAHAVTIALATALQESKLVNLTGGDRDSAGLFQQRPSQDWGTYAQVTDPVYASTAFYQRLRKISDWATLPVTEAAQQVQHSAGPDAYADWESEARATASALTGQAQAALTCHDLAIKPTSANLVTSAKAELGTATLSGAHDATHGWSIASWLVANAMRFGVDKVSFAGRNWTAASGAWSAPASGANTLSLHRVST